MAAMERRKQLSEALLGTYNRDDTRADDPLVTEYVKAGFFSRATFFWMNKLLQKGYASTLQVQDVPFLPSSERAEAMYDHFQSEWPEQVTGANNPVWRPLLKCFWPQLTATGILALTRVIVMYVGPVLILRFVSYTSGNRDSLLEGYSLVLILLLAKVTEVYVTHQYNFRIQRLALLMRAALITSVYRKGLRLSGSSRQAHGVGQIVNYMSVDIQAVSDAVIQLHNVWILPVQLIVALTILYNVVGISALAALAMVIVVSIFTMFNSKKQQHVFRDIMMCKDKRMKATNEALNFMKIVKLHAWEERFLQKIESYRQSEYRWLTRFFIFNGGNAVALWSSPSLLSVVTFGTCSLLKIGLDPGRAFAAVSTFRTLQDPLRLFPQSLSAIALAINSLYRLDKYLHSKDLDMKAVTKLPAGNPMAVMVERGVFSWTEEAEEPTLSDINLSLECGPRIVTVVGPVGSGKTSLLASLLGEIPKLAGTVKVSGSTAYVAQTAWIMNATVQDNILFGKPMDVSKYQETLRVCALRPDLDVMEFGDQTEIGERGVNLSGGQKQRIQLARAVYQDCDIFLLDDIFSAVDAHTGAEIFKECILGALSKKLVVLVTHQVEFLPRADLILVMRDGRIIESGTYDELDKAGTDFDMLVAAHHAAMASVDIGSTGDKTGTTNPLEVMINQQVTAAANVGVEVTMPSAPRKLISLEKSTSKAKSLRRSLSGSKATAQSTKLIEDEERTAGHIGWSVYWLYLTKVYGWPFLLIVVLTQIAWQVLLILNDYWLAHQTSSASDDPSRFIRVYASVAGVSWVAVVILTILVAVFGLNTAQDLYLQMLRSVFRAPMSFFDTTPTGRVLSRSSTDQATLDVALPMLFSGTLALYCTTLGNLVVTCQVTWQVVILVLPLAYIYFKYQAYYITSARELTRMGSITKAPIIHHFSESLAGATTIRCFNKMDHFARINVDRIDSSVRMDFHTNGANEWLGYRLEMIGTLVLCMSALLLVTLPAGVIRPELVGLCLSYGLALNQSLFWVVYMSCMIENNMVSVERINQYMHIPSEAPLHVKDHKLSPSWPSEGTIVLQNLEARYRPTTPLVLRGVSLTIASGQKIGVVGRTGSGKSTIIQTFFRLIEPSGGRILIDGIDISTLGLMDLRSRLGIVPQDPTLFEGSIRNNLDPLGQYTDVDMWESLRKCQLAELVHEKPEKLDAPVLEEGNNWSVGQRQLLCLARALLKRSRILFLDEATASVDTRTDAVIQRTVREVWESCTVVSIAHRIPTVMDADRVIVMALGKVMEYDTPNRLLQQPTSLFTSLVKEYVARGAESSDSE